MPVLNVTVPDSSPLISFIGGWDDTPKADGSWQQYQNQTYHVTNDPYAQLLFRFNGSAVYVYGARGPGYGSFFVHVDSASPQEVPCDSDSIQFNTLLWSSTGLDASKQHGLSLAHGNKMGDIDIDYLVITAGDGNRKTVSQDTFWNDDDAHIVYYGGWTVDENAAYSGGRLHLTSDINAFATITFEGNAIALYGMTGSDHGSFMVSIDGSSPSIMNGTAPDPRYQMLMYYVNDLPNGQHILNLSNAFVGDSQGNYTGLDTVQVSSWVDAPLSVPNSPSPTHGIQSASGVASNPGPQNTAIKTPAPVSHAKSTKIIAAAVIAAVLGVVLCISVAFYVHRRRHKTVRRRESERVSHPFLLSAAPSVPSQHFTSPRTTPSSSTQTSGSRSGAYSKTNGRQTRFITPPRRQSLPGPSRQRLPEAVEPIETVEESREVGASSGAIRATEVIREADPVSEDEAVDVARAESMQRVASWLGVEVNTHPSSPPPTYCDPPPTYREDNPFPPTHITQWMRS